MKFGQISRLFLTGSCKCKRRYGTPNLKGPPVLFTTHALIQSWYYNRNSRLWNHPSFDPLDDTADHDELVKSFIIDQVIYDELELGEFLLVLEEPLYRFIKEQQLEMDDWKKLSKREKNRYFQDLRHRTRIF